MFEPIDPHGTHAPSAQICARITQAIAAGRFESGARLPSVRALAVDVRVNPNTVARAYREMMHAGILETRPGDGIFVTQHARERCLLHVRRDLNLELERIAGAAIAAGLLPQEVAEELETSLEKATRKAAVSPLENL